MSEKEKQEKTDVPTINLRENPPWRITLGVNAKESKVEYKGQQIGLITRVEVTTDWSDDRVVMAKLFIAAPAMTVVPGKVDIFKLLENDGVDTQTFSDLVKERDKLRKRVDELENRTSFD